MNKPQNIDTVNGKKQNNEPSTAKTTEIKRLTIQQKSNSLPSLFNLDQGLIFSTCNSWGL